MQGKPSQASETSLQSHRGDVAFVKHSSWCIKNLECPLFCILGFKASNLIDTSNPFLYLLISLCHDAHISRFLCHSSTEQVPGYFRGETKVGATPSCSCVMLSDRQGRCGQDLNTPSLWIFVPVLIPCSTPGGDTEHNCKDDDVISFIVIIDKTISSISSAVLLLWWWVLAVIGGTAAWDRQWVRRCKTGVWTLWLWGCTYQILNF